MKSLDKALDVLGCFTIEKPEWGITELSDLLGLCKSNVYDIVKTFQKRGYLDQDVNTSKYRLGYQLVKRSFVVSNTRTEHGLVLPKLMELANALNEKVYYGTIDEDMVIYLEQAAPNSQYFVYDTIGGNTSPLHCTGIGKALLAFRDDAYIASVLDKGLKRFTDNTITDREAFMDEVRQIRARGYSIDNMEHVYGIKCVGMPVLASNGQSVTAISVTGPSLRINDDVIPTIAKAMRGTVAALKGALYL